jgi:hypothetical protein
VGSLLDSIPGVGGLMNRWFAAPSDVGVIFAPRTYVKLAGYELKLPVDISASVRRRVTVRENEGLRDTVKSVTPTATMDITLAGRVGDWRKSTLPPIPTMPVVGGAVATGAGILSALLGTSAYIDKTEVLAEMVGIIRKFEDPVLIEDAGGILAAIGVFAVVPTGIDLSPARIEYAWTMSLLWDLDEDPVDVLWPEEEEAT